jgi:tetratricopeptide (TPR) repeat protein
LQRELPAATDVKERQPKADEQKSVSDLTAIDWFKKGYSFALSGKYEEAVGAYDKSVTLNLNFVEAYYVRGVAYYHLGDPKRAIQDLDRAIELNRTYAEAHFMKGLAFNKLGNPGKATENYIVAARLGMKTAQDHLKGQGIAW